MKKNNTAKKQENIVPEQIIIKNKIDKKTIVLFQKLASKVAPPPKQTISQWADNHRKLSPEASAEPGNWKTDKVPFQRGIMDAISDPITEIIIVMSSAQVGKTEMLLNTLGFYVDYDPAPIMLLQPTLEMAQAFSKDRLAPMVRDTPALKGKIKESKAKDSGNTILHKVFPGGHITMSGANSPASLASRPIRIVLADEIDRYPTSAGTEGDPLFLVSKRTARFWNRKLVYVSTPTIKGSSRIELAFNESSQEQFSYPCPVCKKYQPITWEQIRFSDEDNSEVTHECIECKSRSDEIAWKSGKGRWIAQNKNVKKRGFHLNELVVPIEWKTWAEIVEEFKEAKRGGPEILKAWKNTTLGLPWEEDGGDLEEEKLLSRREFYNCQVPDQVLVLTAAVDVQDNRLETEVVGWGLGKESWAIECQSFFGDPGQAEVWKQLDDYLQKQFTYKDGSKVNISITCIDSGGHFTNEVYVFCKRREHRRVFAIKGKGGTGLPLVSKPTKNNRVGAHLFTLGVDTGKELVYSRLKIEEYGPGFCHFPLEQDRNYDQTYFKGLNSEKRILKFERGKANYKWIKKPGTRNEPLDLRNYNIAALEILNPELEMLAKRKKSKNVDQVEPGRRKVRRRIISKGV